MKKILIVLLSAFVVLGVSSIAKAENSASASSGTRYAENQVFIVGYNNSGSDISSNQIVILDTTATAGTTLGAYITRTTTANDSRVLGVTDVVIADGSAGAVCVRGPHKVRLTGETALKNQFVAGASISTTTTAGIGALPTTTNKPEAIAGRLLSATASSESPDIYWIWVK